MKKINKISGINIPGCHQIQAVKESNAFKNKQTISQLSPFGASCSANSGVGLSFTISKAENSHLPGVRPGAATITNYLLPVCSPRDALGNLYQMDIPFSKIKDKNLFTRGCCFSFVTRLKTRQINNREGPGPPMG